MVERLIDSETGAIFRDTLRQLQEDVHTELHTDAYAVWRVSRGGTWVSDISAEARSLVEIGTGKLYENGAGGPQAGEMVIHVESPYRFRTLATADIEDGDWIVLNEDRVFAVDVGKRESVSDVLMNVYMAEITDVVEVPA